jgi:4-aminobutyrate aminotransferase-like enzyme
LSILQVIQRENLAENARRVGDFLKDSLLKLRDKYPTIIQNVRGLGLMIGLELTPNIPNLPGESTKTQAVRFANLLHVAGLLVIPAGAQILRFLPPLNLRQSEAEEGLKIVESIVARLVA